MRNHRTVLGAASGLFFVFLAATDLAAQTWWDANYQYRRRVTVTTGPNTPNLGYSGYTVRVPGFDTAALVTATKMRSDGNDLRVVYWNGTTWTELARDVIGINTAATDLRYMLSANISALSTEAGYFLYYGNAAAAAPPAVTTTNVYRWWDDASADLTASYLRGRVDDTAHGDTVGSVVTHNAGGYYDYSTPNDKSVSMRPTGITERDVYVEYEFFQTGAHPNDMTSGPLCRLTVTGTTNDNEVSNGHYYFQLGDSSFAGTTPYAQHGDLCFNNRTQDVDAVNDALGQVAGNQWNKVAIATWSVNPTTLKGFYDATPVTSERGGFGAAAVTTKTHAAAADVETVGQVGAWLMQDIGRLRSMLVRRYVEPEPTSSVGVEEVQGSPNPPAISLTPVSLTFSALEGGANPSSQTFAITNAGGGTLAWAANELVAAAWLSESPASGSLASGANATVTVSVDITGLTAAMSPYTATIRVSDGGASNTPIDVSVTLIIGADNLTVAPPTLTFTAVEGDPNPPSQNVTISNTGTASMNWTATHTAAAWLGENPASGTLAGGANTTMAVSVNIAGLTAAGSPYTSTITVDDTSGLSTSKTVVVTLTITAPTTPRIGLNPTTLTFTGVEFGPNPASQNVTVTNTGVGTLDWTATHPAADTWLSENPASGSLGAGANQTMAVSVDTTGLAPGTYTSTITVSATGASNTPRTISVTLTVTSTTAPRIGLSATTLTFSAPQDGANPPAQTVTVSNIGAGTLVWTAPSPTTWLSLSPAGGSLAAGAGQAVSVSVNILGLAEGVYTATVTVSDSAASNNPQTISVTLNVTARIATRENDNGDHCFFSTVTPQSAPWGMMGAILLLAAGAFAAGRRT